MLRTSKPVGAMAMMLAASFLCCGAARAADDAVPPPVFLESAASPRPTLAARPASHLRLGSFEVVLEETPLSRIRDTVAAGAIAEQGDASARIYWLCYTILRKTAAERVWIISSAEFGGPEHAVTGIVAATDAGGAVASGCPALPLRYQALSLDHGVWLGLRRDDLIRRVGQPSRQEGETLEFAYDGGTELAARTAGQDDDTDDADVTSYLAVQLSAGRVARLCASKLTSD